jgi:hypothetical protein
MYRSRFSSRNAVVHYKKQRVCENSAKRLASKQSAVFSHTVVPLISRVRVMYGATAQQDIVIAGNNLFCAHRLRAAT